MNRMVFTVFLMLPAVSLAQAPVEYDVSFENAAHHEARITVTWTDIGTAPLQVRMSRSSPGRYALHEFAKNVYQVWVVNGNGVQLEFTRPNPYQWDIADHDGTVSITYTLYADRAGGTYSGIDLTHAHLNMPATFMWARGLAERPISISFSPAVDDWKVATQLEPTDDQYLFTAPNLQYFLDSPTELSNFTERTWSVEVNGRSATFRLALHHDGTEGDADKYLDMAKNVVAAQIDIFGEIPEFDYGTYTFIADYLPYVVGDGMEHRNSTILANTDSLLANDFSQLGTLSHEFIHAWNVERIRPASLEPFDFEQANMSANLWFAEGFTSYYGNLAIRRAGESTTQKYINSLAGSINTVSFSSGRNFASAPKMSMQAPFVDAASAIDPTNFDNTFVSYYTYGSALGLALDLSLRAKFDGVSLDSFMRHVWLVHGKTEAPYTNDDLQTRLAEVTDHRKFADDFFDRYVHGQELPDYKTLLENAGVLMRQKDTASAYAGPLTLEFDGKEALIAENTIIGSPLYMAGLDRGDRIVAIDRLKITSQGRWKSALGRYAPGDTATIAYEQRGVARTATIKFKADPQVEVLTYESADLSVSDTQLAFRTAWLGVDENE
jgi:predicted metalloprotease with PDZ domain